VPCSQESYGQHAGTWSTSAPERSYLTITTVPSLNKCQDCLKVAASYEEEGKKSSRFAQKQILRMFTVSGVPLLSLILMNIDICYILCQTLFSVNVNCV
jgi:hypothetical protein